MDPLSEYLERSAAYHSHLCPRQILGVRIGLLGLRALGFEQPPMHKRLLVITETDGCFADGLSTATECTVGHRTLRVEDFGKTAVVFVDTLIEQCVRVTPTLDIREKAYEYAPNAVQHYAAQMQAYQTMPDDVMFTVQSVTLNMPVADIVSRPGMRVNCSICGEEIMNEREIKANGLILCRACAGGAYYHDAPPLKGDAVRASAEIKVHPLLNGK